MNPCCISFVSYIKPQPTCPKIRKVTVVYLLFPTSNHNKVDPNSVDPMLYIFCFLHQTTTIFLVLFSLNRLDIFCFLHQTTTLALAL